MRAAGRRGDEVHVGLARQAALGRPAQSPGRAGAGREVLVAGGGVFLASEDRRGKFAVELFGKVLAHAVGKAPGGRRAVLDAQADFQTGKQHGLATQQALEFALRDVRRVEKLGVRPDAQPRAAGALGGVPGAFERFDDVAAGKGHAEAPAVARHLDLKPRRQGVGDRDANPVQTAREAVGRAAVVLVEFAAGVQAGEHHFDGRHLLHRVDFNRNAATVVVDRDRTVGV